MLLGRSVALRESGMSGSLQTTSDLPSEAGSRKAEPCGVALVFRAERRGPERESEV